MQIKDLFEYISNSKNFDEFESLEKERVYYPFFPEGAISFFISYYFTQKQDNIYLILDSLQSAESTFEEVCFYLGIKDIENNEKVIFLPEPWIKDIENEEFTYFYEKLISLKNKNKKFILITYSNTLLMKFFSEKRITQNVIKLSFGDKVNPEKLKYALARNGYERVKTVYEPGQFSIKGSIIDVFPLYRKYPIRLSLWDDEIEEIKEFDIYSQLSIRTLPLDDVIEILPFNSLDKYKKETQLISLFDILPDGLFFVYNIDKIISSIENLYEDYKSLWEEQQVKKLLNSPHDVKKLLFQKTNVFFGGILEKNIKIATHTFKSLDFYFQNFKEFLLFLDQYRIGKDIFIFCETESQVSRLSHVLKEEGFGHINCLNPDEISQIYLKNKDFENKIVIAQGLIHNGFCWEKNNLFIISEREIFGKYKKERTLKIKPQKGKKIQDINDLNEGDIIVHLDYGIGIYRGLKQLTIDNTPYELIKLEYADGDEIYIQITDLAKLQKYISPIEGYIPKLTKLGSNEWQKQKKKIQKGADKVAKYLVELYSKRMSQKGYAFSPDTYLQEEFESAFPYEETPDQIKAIEEIKRDMESSIPMERLLCGDVGFGKTEVAMRAAFKAVQDKKQVAVLAPTTILAQQHYYTFTERFKGFNVRIEVLSSLKNKKEQNKILQALKKGEIDIIIGTHRLLSDDVKFFDLGLLIIDEEQRFGVRQKEKMKELKANVDVLYLSATPIPRTLNMALSGLKDISIIETPPHNRLPIITKVAYYNKEIVKSALMKELSRGGQVYYLYNDIDKIALKAEEIKSIVPFANIAYLHAKMKKDKIEKTLIKFILGEIDILVATTIIENGLDIPNVNTLIIEGAENFGLAQLYQIRGRIGRRNIQGYAYFLIKSKNPTEKAKKRLEVIQAFNYLGSGFEIAKKDMQIRGVGNLLGKEQHGYIMSIGIEAYTQILKKAIKNFKTHHPEFDLEVEISWDRPSYIPETYVEDEHQRYLFYKRLSFAENTQQLKKIISEFQDRYGKEPVEVKNLILLVQLKLICKKHLIKSLHLENFLLEIESLNKINPERIKSIRNVIYSVKKLTDKRFCFKLKKRDIKTLIFIIKSLTKGDAKSWTSGQ